MPRWGTGAPETSLHEDGGAEDGTPDRPGASQMTSQQCGRARAGRAKDEAADWFARHLRDAEVARSAEFKAWLSADEANAAAYGALQTLWRSDALGEALTASTPMPPACPAPVVPCSAPPRRSWRRSSGSGWAVAASVALLVVVAGMAGGVPHAAVDRVQALFADHATTAGERQVVVLEDGSRITLNSGSAIDITHAPGGPRVTLLAGEAYFEVRPVAAGQAFVVRTGEAEVRVIGTAFAVRDHGGDGTGVVVRHGAVAVRNPLSGESRTLAAGEAVVATPTGRVSAAAADPDALAWVVGRIQFHDRPLRDVLAELDRHVPGFVILVDKELGDLPVSGSYRLDDPVGVVRSLAGVVGARLHRVTDHLLVIRR